MQIETLGKKCTGCGACAASCPAKCIVMKPDGEGFLYPEVGDDCLGCERCTNVCPVISYKKTEAKAPKTFAAYNKNAQERLSSSSGGIFVLLAKRIIDDGGAVYGAALLEDMSVHHIRVSEACDICRLQGSKYVQSIVDSRIYDGVKKDLEAGRKVLFSGTPCQCAAIRSSVGENEGFFTVSFICHGVPSPAVWREYIKMREEKENSRTVNASFRDKQLGWEHFSMKIEFENGSVYTNSLEKDPYLRAFLRNVCLRENCYNCIFKGDGAYGGVDVLLSDWWGAVSGILPEKLDDKGLSAVYLLSERGDILWESVKDDCVSVPIDFKKASDSNGAFRCSVARPAARDVFIKEVSANTFEECVNKYAKSSFSARLKQKAINLSKKLKIYAFLKKLAGR